MTTPGGSTRLDFATNLPEILLLIKTGMGQLEATLSKAGGGLAKQGVLGQALAADARGIDDMMRRSQALAARYDEIMAMPTRGKNQRARQDAALQAYARELADFERQVGQVALRAQRGIASGIVEDPKQGPAMKQLALVGAEQEKQRRQQAQADEQARKTRQAAAEKELNEELKRSERRQRAVRDDIALERERAERSKAAAAGYTPIGGGFLASPDRQHFLRETQKGAGARELFPTEAETRQAHQRLANYERDLQRAQARNLGRTDALSSFLGVGHEGNDLSLAGLANTARSAVKYSLAYGSIFATGAAFRDTINEAKDYRDSLTDLEVALGRVNSAEQTFVDQLSQTSRLAGGNVGQALDSAARGVRAFTDPDESDAVKQQVGGDFAEAVGRAAIITGKSITDIRGDVIAIASAFDIVRDDFQSINDVIAGSKLFGGDPLQISQGLASAGIALKEAGFSFEESAALISRANAVTDQSGATLATRYARITSIISGSAGRGLLATLPGVGVDGTAAQQLFRVAQVYKDLNKSQQAAVRNTLGQANIRELLVALDEMGPGGALEEGFKDGFDNAGKGADEANRKINDLVGTLKKLQGSVSNIQNNLFDSGLFAPFSALVAVLEPGLQTLDDLLNIFNLLPEPLRVIAVGLGEVALAFTIMGAVQARNAQKIQVANAALAEQNALLGLNAGAATRAGAAGAAAGAAGVGGVFSKANYDAGRQRTGQFLGGTSGKVLGAAAGVIVLDQFIRNQLESQGKIADATKAEVAAREELLKATSVDSLQSLAKALTEVAEASDEASSGILGNVNDAYNKSRVARGAISGLAPVIGILNEGRRLFTGEDPVDQERQAKRAREARGIVEKQAEELQRAQEANARGQNIDQLASVFGDITSVEQLNAGLEILSNQGRSATETIQALSRALGQGFTDLGSVGTILPGQVPQLSADLGAAYLQTLDRAVDQVATDVGNKRQRRYSLTDTPDLLPGVDILPDTSKEKEKALRDRLSGVDVLDRSKLNKSVQDEFKAFIEAAGVEDGGQLSAGQIEELAVLLADKYAQVLPDITDEEKKALTEAMTRLLKGKISELTDPSKIEITADNSAAVQKIYQDFAGKVAGETGIVTNGDKVAQALASLTVLTEGKARVIESGTQVTRQTELALAQAQQNYAEAVRERSAAMNIATASGGVGQAQASLENARAAVQAQTYGTTQFWNALGEYNRSIDALADAQTEQAIAERAATLDYTDDLAVAQAAVQDARDRLKSYENRKYAGAGDFAPDGTPVPATENPVEAGTGMGSDVITGFKARDWYGTGASAGQMLAGGFQAGVAGIMASLQGVLATEARRDAARSANAAAPRVSLTNQRRDAAMASRGPRSTAPAPAPAPAQDVNTAAPGLDPAELARRRAAVRQAEAAEARAREAAAKQAQQEAEQRRREALALKNAQVMAQAGRDAISQARAQMQVANNTMAQYSRNDAEWWQAYGQYRQAQDSLAKATLDLQNAQTTANAYPTSQMQQASAQMDIAWRTMANYSRDEIEWWQAYGQYRQAQIQLAEAARNHIGVMHLLNGDFTDPVHAARVEAEKARLALQDAQRNGAPEDVTDPLLLDYRRSEAAVQKAVFDQQLSDLNVRRQLGEISDRAYLQYLTAERNRLQNIRNRTRQQQDMLNEVNLAIKAANEQLTGQWNLGDMKVPTPYEVRRAVAGQLASTSTSAVSTTVQNNTQITINGSDLAQVKAVLGQYLGPTALARTTTPTKV